MLGQSISRNAILLGLFAILSTAIIAGTYLSTAPVIGENARKAEAKALLQIFPQSTHDNSLLDDAYPINDVPLLGLRKQKKYYIARKDGQPIGVIIPATARDGYTDDIDLIVGIRVDGSVAGVRVLAQRETPGLGDSVDYKKTHWVDEFIDKSLGNPDEAQWKVKKDGGVFDQFTGATITPRAVTKAIKNTLIYFAQNRQKMLAAGAEKLTQQEAGKHG